MKIKFTPIIQVRMKSTRLPRKALRKIGEKVMLEHVINQTLCSKYVKDVIIATTLSKEDKKIVDFCKKLGLKYYRGSNRDVLDRFYKAAKKFSCDPIIRISSDCPFIDPKVIDKVISKFLKKSYDYIGNNIEKDGKNWKNSLCNFPQGMVVEISSFKTLEKAWKEAKKQSEREHVFPYVQFNPQIFKISNIKNSKNLSYIRCTVDRNVDLKFVNKIHERISKKRKFVRINDIEKIVKKKPKLLNINNKIPFDEGYQKSLRRDK